VSRRHGPALGGASIARLDLGAGDSRRLGAVASCVQVFHGTAVARSVSVVGAVANRNQTPGVRIVASDLQWSSGVWQDALVLVWRGPTDLAHAQAATDLLREITRLHDGVGVVVVVEPEAPPPDAGTRPIFAKAMRECGSRIAGAAYVIGTGGFMGAAVRGAITSLSLIAREPYPTRTFQSVASAACWLAPRMTPGPHPDALSHAIESLRGAAVV